ncbi:MAG: MlaE family lipid ABC transporter permease subunit [Polyangiaceae bacterium]|nr:MlaE family lipid ABC transporter permease subunit [Polyangiaceae bacterium]
MAASDQPRRGSGPEPGSSRGARAAFSVERGDGRLLLGGDLGLPVAARLWRDLHTLSRAAPPPRLDLDLGGVAAVDGAAMALLVELRAELATRGIECEIVGASRRLEPLVHLYGGHAPPRLRATPARTGWLERLGRATVDAGRGLELAVAFVGAIVAALGGVLRRPASGNWRAVPSLAERAGIDGVPIVLLLDFLVGFVMGYQSADQLALYGAHAFVADVVGISVVRELSPLMTAIVVSGRSGAAFAAEIGTMRVSEEIDALRTMGFCPVRYLVLPRVAALALVGPVLTLLGDIVGVAGGALVGVIKLDIGPTAYLAELRTAIFPADVATGLVKGAAFGVAIALIGCHHGFATTGGAAGVGRRTTATVVTCLFTIVVLDTLFTVFFRMLGL